MLEKVTQALQGIPYMRESRAAILREFMIRHDLTEVLEIGFFRGRSSTYIAAILEEMGRGHLVTIDRASARDRKPGIGDCLERTGLSHRVSYAFAERSYTWELARMVRRTPRPVFDLCYFDGGHTWDSTGFGVLLVDMLLRPGGWIVLDDLDWTIQASIAKGREGREAKYAEYSEDERTTPAVRLTLETIMPHLGYEDIHERDGWGYARKPRHHRLEG